PRVLPVPVLACPMMSRCPSAMGRVRAWIGNGWEIPESSSARTISLRTPKSANVCVGADGSAVAVCSDAVTKYLFGCGADVLVCPSHADRAGTPHLVVVADRRDIVPAVPASTA